MPVRSLDGCPDGALRDAEFLTKAGGVMDLLDDTENAKGILKDAEAAQATGEAALKAAFDQMQATTEELRKALAAASARGF